MCPAPHAFFEQFVETLLAFRWYLVLQLFGLAALPLALRLFGRLPGRGYALARPLGLLMGGWAFWLLLTFGWLPNTAGAVLAALALLLAFGLALRFGHRPPDRQPLSARHIIAVELVFGVAFVAWCLVRAHMPRIETSGGEKWMEIAFLNSVLRADRFPPQDPWLSGFGISYYYFGYVMMAMLTRLANVPATIGFNLGIATIFALTCGGAYGLVYALLARGDKRQAGWQALFGPLLVALAGNLEGVLEVLHARGLFSAAFWQWLDIRSLNVPPPPLAEGSWMPTRFIWWWQASRVIHDTAPWHTIAHPANLEVIDEFPAFSFLLGDMHPHLLALPFALLALTLALALLRRNPRPQTAGRLLRHLLHRDPETTTLPLGLESWELLVYALCLGGLGFLNVPSDFAIYLFITAAAFALHLRNSQPAIRNSQFATRTLLFALALAGGGLFLYLPFWIGLRSQVSGLMPNLFNGTRLPQFIVMFGPLLLPLATLTVASARVRRVKAADIAVWTVTLLMATLSFLLLAVVITPQGREYWLAYRSGSPIPGLEGIPNAPLLIAARLKERLLTPWTPLVLAVPLVTTFLILIRRSGPEKPGETQPATLQPELSYVLLLIATGSLLALSVEFVYVRDLFGTRMNTVFKFYFQVWVLWSIAAAYGLGRLVRSRSPVSRLVLGTSLVLVVASLIYLALAIPTRAREHSDLPTLDGAAYLAQSHAADMAAISWLNRQIEGTPVVLEAPADHGGGYTYEGRVSAFTGLPTLLGWSGHEQQWRGTYEEQAHREPVIETIYSTNNPAETLTLLREYDVQYVYVGPVEWDRYPAAGLTKFARFMEVVYDADGVVIYRRAASTTDIPPRPPGPQRPHGGEIAPQP